MPGDTAVEQPAVPAETVTEEKKEIVEAEAKAAEAAEKKDEEKEAKDEKKEKPKKAKAPPPVHKKDFEKDVVYMYQFGRAPKLPSISRYCLKLETWLKLQGIKYENIDHNSKLRSKQGLLPFVEYNGEEIPDSEHIIITLGEKLDKNLDTGMDAKQENTQHAMVAMVENHLHWCHTHWLTRNIDNFINGYGVNLKSMMNSKMPESWLKLFIKHTYVRRQIKKLKATGFNAYTDEEVDAMANKDLRVLSDLLGDNQFFFGDELRSLDLKAFVILALILNVEKEVACPMRDYVEGECKNLVGLYNRVKDQAWGDDWDAACGENGELNPHIPKPEPPKEEENNKDEKAEEKEKADDEKEKEEVKENEEKESDNKDNKDEEKK